MFAATVAAKPA